MAVSIGQFEEIFVKLINRISDLERRVEALEYEEVSGVDVVNNVSDIETPRENHLVLDNTDGKIKRYTEGQGWVLV